MLDVAVVNPPIALGRDFIDYPYFASIGPIQAATVLRDQGRRVAIVDALAQPESDLHARGDEFLLGAPIAERLPAARAYVVALNPWLNPLLPNADVAAIVDAARTRNAGARIVLADCYVGGQHYIDHDAAATLAPYPAADAIAKGEPERALPALLDDPAARVAAPVFGEVDLAALPPPDWTLVDTAALHAFWRRIGHHGLGQLALRDGSMPLLTARGCVYRCAFCTSAPGLDHRRRTNRTRPIADVARHVETLKSLGAKHIHVLDELANFDPDRFAALLDALAGAGVTYEFPNGLRADRLEPRHLDRMKGRVGFFSISAESASERVLNGLLEKGLDPAHVERVARECAERALPLAIHWMIGVPGETRAEINRTLEEALRLRDAYGAEPLLQFATPIPGTRMDRAARESGALAEDVRGRIGPLFQTRSVVATGEFTPDDLARFKASFDARLAIPPRAVEKVILNATYRCNNRCVFCATGDRVPVDGDFERQVAALADYRARGATLADFDGGEPTLYARLFDLIAKARELGYRRVCVTTNGQKCADPAFARALSRSGVTDLLVSLHGPDRATHERMTDTPGSFEKTVAGARNILRLGPRGLALGINVTVGRGNLDALVRHAAFVRALGYCKLNIQFITPFGRAAAPVVPDPSEVAPRAREVIDRFGRDLDVQLINLPWCFLPGYERHMASDVGKRTRDMVFVWNEDVQLGDYLAAKRQKREVCSSCAFNVLCDGFYVFPDEAPTEVLDGPRPRPHRLPLIA